MKYLTILFLFATTIAINAQDIVVNGSGLPGTYSTISAAVQAANSGDKILVSNQAFPYQEDTLFIDKDVTILPYSDITHIEFEGDIQITLDSISDLTLIGFDSPETDIFTVFNDTTRNSLSTVNIVDCHFNEINLDQPKTSLYLSYSTAVRVRFSHGDIIGNKITSLLSLGIHDWSNSSTSIQNSFENMYSNTLSDNNISLCDLYENNVRFGNVETYSDTCNIIANNISLNYISLNTMDFAFNLRNNQAYCASIKLSCDIDKGTNQIINNNTHTFRFITAYCDENERFNFSNVKFDIFNNQSSYSNNNMQIEIDHPNVSNTGFNASEVENNSISAYNDASYINSESNYNWPNLENVFFVIGPDNNNNQNPNPSPAYLNLDLTPNIIGIEGGSDAWSNYHPSGTAGFGTMTGSKARITYLNLPTQIFDPNNIQIKAKAVHGN